MLIAIVVGLLRNMMVSLQKNHNKQLNKYQPLQQGFQNLLWPCTPSAF